MSKQIVLTLRLQYSEDVTPEEVCDLVQNALESCRQEGMLSDPEWLNDPSREELSCDWISTVPAKD